MVTNIKIRPVRSGDWLKFETLVAGICAFHGNKHGLTRSQFDDFATRENAPVTVLVAETEDSILAGFVAGFPNYSFQAGKTIFEIQNLYVAEEFRRQRIGEVLMMNIMQSARRKCGEVTFKLGARGWNEGALEFYKQLGFIPSPNSRETVKLIRDSA
jgi:ribosomal protein S18 acetylase RimI-like enzyme